MADPVRVDRKKGTQDSEWQILGKPEFGGKAIQSTGTNKASQLDRASMSILSTKNHESGGEGVTKKCVFGAEDAALGEPIS
jgi:hypothetical protein